MYSTSPEARAWLQATSLEGQPDFHRHLDFALAQALEQPVRAACRGVGGIAVPVFDDVLGDAGLDSRAGPVKV